MNSRTLQNWSPQATYEATIMFSSNLNASLAEKFYSHILLPCVRADIKKSNKLNIHYYKSLKKAIFKPSGFFKGIIIPLSDSNTAKEASIIGYIVNNKGVSITASENKSISCNGYCFAAAWSTQCQDSANTSVE